MNVPNATVAVMVAVIVIGVLALYVVSVVWAYNDADRRGKSGCLVAILVAFLSWPLGLLAWIIFRPVETTAQKEQWEPQFIQCQCGKQISVNRRMAGSEVACPSCGAMVTAPGLSQFRKAQ